MSCKISDGADVMANDVLRKDGLFATGHGPAVSIPQIFWNLFEGDTSAMSTTTGLYCKYVPGSDYGFSRTHDCALSASKAMSKSFFLGANGFVTVTPFQVNPSCKSSERSKRHPPSAAAERITASQILS